jgi:hypothetical protein
LGTAKSKIRAENLFMALSLDQQHALLIAERSRDVDVITSAVDCVLAANPDATPLDIEMAFREGGSPIYLLAGPTLSVVIGMPAWRAALDRAGLSPETNRTALKALTAAGRRSSLLAAYPTVSGDTDGGAKYQFSGCAWQDLSSRIGLTLLGSASKLATRLIPN